MTKYANLNPASPENQSKPGFDDKSFAALIRVKSSRFAMLKYNDDTITPKIGIHWEMESTRGNIFSRDWSTGVDWDASKVVDDGKRMTEPVKANSNAMYLLSKATLADFPTGKLGDDISVFEGEVFFMTEDTNPKARGSKKTLYPKQYHSEGWEAAKAEALARQAAKAAQQNAPAYTSPSSTTSHPPVVQGEVMKTAEEALLSILGTQPSINRNQIVKALDEYIKTNAKTWDDKFRKEVTAALFAQDQLSQIINNNPKLKLEGNIISLQQ